MAVVELELPAAYLVLASAQNVTSSPQYSTFLEHIIPRFLTFLQDGEVQFLQEKPAQVSEERRKETVCVRVCLCVCVSHLQESIRPSAFGTGAVYVATTLLFSSDFLFCFLSVLQQLRKLVLEIIHRIPTNEHLRPHTKNILSVMFRFLEVSWTRKVGAEGGAADD